MSESIGVVLPTLVPGLTENANIQEALRLYHYGSKTSPSNIASLLPNSVAGHINSSNQRIQILENLGIGSSFAPTEPSNKTNGYFWVKSDSLAPIYHNFFVAYYQESEPLENLSNGLLWIKDSDKSIRVYDEDDESWKTVSSGALGSLGSYHEVTLTGQGIDITGLDAVAASQMGLPPIFGYVDGITPVLFSTFITVTSDNSLCEVDFIFGKVLSGSAGNIGLARLINGQDQTIISEFYFNGQDSPIIRYTDDHGAPEGSIVSYVLINLSAETIVFDGSSGAYAVQARSREII